MNSGFHFHIQYIILTATNLFLSGLYKGGPFTLFAPSNKAFRAIDESKLSKLMRSPDQLKSILLGHLMDGTFFVNGLLHSPDIHTQDGGSVKIVTNGTRK